MLQIREGHSGLYSNNGIVLEVLQTNCGNIATCKAAPILWKHLPHVLRDTEKIPVKIENTFIQEILCIDNFFFSFLQLFFYYRRASVRRVNTELA